METGIRGEIMENFTVYNETVDELPIIIDLPHSGTFVPETIKSKMVPGRILPNVDWFLPELYDFLPQNGFTTLQNNLHRYIADPNRDLSMTDVNGDYRYEIVYSQTTFGKPIYQNKLTEEEIEQRITQFYQPYHAKLQELIDHKLEKFDKIYLFDLHSFAEYPHEDVKTQDVVLGNRFDTTSSTAFRKFLTEQLNQKGYTVSNNHPFSGGYITPHYGANKRVKSMQIELAYHMYIENRYFGEEELTGVDVGTFTTAKNSLQSFFMEILNYILTK